jgi:hypothetical protein
MPRNLGLCKVDYKFADSTWLVQHMQTGPYVFTTS